MNPKSFSFTSKDGLFLLGRVWLATTQAPKGIVFFVHGLGEHSGRYDHVGKALTKAGYHFTAFDLRGHGLSEGPRGHAPDLSILMDDIQRFINETTQHLGNHLPKFIYGHSSGGNLVVYFCVNQSADFCGSIVTSPDFIRTAPQPKVKLFLAKIIAKLMPGFTLTNGLEPDALSRNKAIVHAYRDDVYVHNKLSARLSLDLLESGRSALKNAKVWILPMLLMHGSADHITSPTASQAIAADAGSSAEFVLWDGYYHELHNDIGSEAVIEKIIHWLDLYTL